MLEEWLGLAVQKAERIKGLGVAFTPNLCRLWIDLSAFAKTFRIDAAVALDGAALDTRRFFLRLAVVEKPQIVPDAQHAQPTLEAVGSAALELLSVENFVRLIGSRAQPIVHGEGKDILIDFDAIAPVRAIFERRFFFWRLRDAFSLQGAHIAEEGLVLKFSLGKVGR
jgi:hypothetical protein